MGPGRVEVHRWSLAAAVLVVVLAAAGTMAAAKDKSRKIDLIWTHPAFDSLAVRSVALLPAASFDNNHQNEKTVEGLFAQVLRPSGYRWVSPLVAREMIRSALGESTLAALDRDLLKNGRVDSLACRRLCRTLRTGGVMSVRLDLFEQVQVEWNQSGKPSTTVQLKAALMDSTGRLLWSASGSETGEGPYHEADAATLGVKGSGLNTTPVTAQGGAPSFEDVTIRLLTHWMQRFPPNKGGAAPARP